ncbi:hypothetical protein HQ325_03215 [Rhodococcus sp. BP-349]|uniref:hypothetical protein n=1 Tax=unclassified Rhodococcus (in: high G+C Gram-positive bacteria) TaxID=192944 RepID=UPI001C9B3A43|nr:MULTISPECIES: hypothetical protein [unclassified Rhodococcus (in: high G+C Gram-positive bacteria)]MBY6537674.1 hypothetical protein [Rhodococcus sp. BP-363]MBY6542011.1 hypothetical protein [Rhodococcus sp. BP-369]MBY6561241.1 hypothetical protein [Rhodococcus sp. BP-370]MBY6575533.1 hypothetical protein [Rhodococcus sp. BP-364]MBY6584834.1 hypothetical protein [Rhodococcus sp. BP-358]
MAHPDDTAADDWFDAAPPATGKRSPVPTPSPAASTDTPPNRRLTVLAEQSPDTDDGGWLTNAPTPTFDAATESQRSGATGPAARPSWWRRHRSAVAVTASLLVLVGAVGATAVFLTGASEDTLTADPAPLLPTTQTAPTVAAEPAAGAAAAADFTWCAGQGAGEPVTEDTTDPGLSTIWRFEKAFYYDRDPVAARAVGAPEAVMASAERLRIGIDALEPEVEFCVLADPISSGVYDVTVLERGPGIDPRTSSQRFTTAESGSTTSITAITRR